MKNRNAITILIMLIIYIIIKNYYLINSSIINIILPLILLIISIFSYFVLPKTERRIKYKYEKFQNIIIILITYFIIYFLSGLFFGYEYSIYKQDFISIIKNIYIIILPIIFSEYIRNKIVVNTNDNNKTNIIISIVLLLMNINLITIFNNLTPFSSGFKYCCTMLLPAIVTSFTMTKISRIAGKKTTIVYNSFLKLIPILVPILPSLPWIISGIISITLPMILYFNMVNFELFHSRRERRYSINNKKEYPFYITIIILILFVLKAFKYYPVAILSNSMKDVFSRGDSVVVEKANNSNIKKLKNYDIIYYKKNNKYIIHRIIEIIEKDDSRIFITKGDNNNNIDNWEVKEEEIVGIIKFSIPYIGYPSVWMNDCMNN